MFFNYLTRRFGKNSVEVQYEPKKENLSSHFTWPAMGVIAICKILKHRNSRKLRPRRCSKRVYDINIVNKTNYAVRPIVFRHQIVKKYIKIDELSNCFNRLFKKSKLLDFMLPTSAVN